MSAVHRRVVFEVSKFELENTGLIINIWHVVVRARTRDLEVVGSMSKILSKLFS